MTNTVNGHTVGALGYSLDLMSEAQQDKCKIILDEALTSVLDIFTKNNVTLFEAAKLKFCLEDKLNDIISKQKNDVLNHVILKREEST